MKTDPGAPSWSRAAKPGVTRIPLGGPGLMFVVYADDSEELKDLLCGCGNGRDPVFRFEIPV